METTRVRLIRHAESRMNVYGRDLIGGRSNQTPLTARGEAAAQALGRQLAAGPAPADVISTSAVRSVQTAQALAQGADWSAPTRIEDGLLELSQGAAEGQPRAQWWTPAVVAAMNADPLRHRLAPDGESHEEVQARVRAAVHRLAGAYPGATVLAVGHGIAIRTLMWSLLGGDHETFQRLELPYLAVVDLDVTASGDLRLPGGPYLRAQAHRPVNSAS